MATDDRQDRLHTHVKCCSLRAHYIDAAAPGSRGNNKLLVVETPAWPLHRLAPPVPVDPDGPAITVLVQWLRADRLHASASAKRPEQ